MSNQLRRRVVIEDVQFLILNGADPTVSMGDGKGNTALHIAAQRDKDDIIKVGHRYRPSFSDRLAVCVQSFFSVKMAARLTNSIKRI